MRAPKSFREEEIARPSLVRTLSVAILLGGAWFVLGWLFASVDWGIAFVAWALVLGPALMPFAIRIWAARERGLRRVDLSSEWSLAGAYFDCLLKTPGLHPEVWAFHSADSLVFWDEPLLKGLFGGRTRIYVSTAWLKADSQRKAREWTHVWRELVAMGPWRRRIRSFQMRLWMGVISPIALLFEGLAFLLRIVGFRDLPTPAFWFQRAAWSLRALWMRLPRGPAEFQLPRRGTVEPPKVWNSLLLGTWVQLSSSADCHPTWRVLVHRSAFLDPVS